jgi:hypothetical protein
LETVSRLVAGTGTIGINFCSLDDLRPDVSWGRGASRLASRRHSTSSPAPVVFVPFVPWHKPSCLKLRNDVDFETTLKDGSRLRRT